MVNHQQPPEVINTFGFKHAPFSQFLLVTTGATSLSVAFLPPRYQHLFRLNLKELAAGSHLFNRQWIKLVSAQLANEHTFDLLSTCVLLYHFLALERRFGTAKYVSFVLFTWSLSLGLYSTAYSSRLLHPHISNIAKLPMGMHGPLFAMLLYYFTDIPPGKEKSTGFNLPFSKKLFVYSIAVQYALSSRQAILMSSCGLLSGLIYKLNLLNVQDWFRIPKPICKYVEKVYSFVCPQPVDPVCRDSFMGATEAIQDDIMFDYYNKMQQMRINHIGMPQNVRQFTGQGYSDILNPSFGGFQNPPTGPELPNAHQQQAQAQSADETKVQALVDMGFAREAVVLALSNSANNIEQATNVLLSSASQ